MFENKYDIQVGDYLLYIGETSSGYTNDKFYYIYEIGGLLAYFKNDDNEIRSFLITKPNGNGWEFIKRYDLRKLKLEKICQNVKKVTI